MTSDLKTSCNDEIAALQKMVLALEEQVAKLTDRVNLQEQEAEADRETIEHLRWRAGTFTSFVRNTVDYFEPKCTEAMYMMCFEGSLEDAKVALGVPRFRTVQLAIDRELDESGIAGCCGHVFFEPMEDHTHVYWHVQWDYASFNMPAAVRDCIAKEVEQDVRIAHVGDDIFTHHVWMDYVHSEEWPRGSTEQVRFVEERE